MFCCRGKKEREKKQKKKKRISNTNIKLQKGHDTQRWRYYFMCMCLFVSVWFCCGGDKYKKNIIQNRRQKTEEKENTCGKHAEHTLSYPVPAGCVVGVSTHWAICAPFRWRVPSKGAPFPIREPLGRHLFTHRNLNVLTHNEALGVKIGEMNRSDVAHLFRWVYPSQSTH